MLSAVKPSSNGSTCADLHVVTLAQGSLTIFERDREPALVGGDGAIGGVLIVGRIKIVLDSVGDG